MFDFIKRKETEAKASKYSGENGIIDEQVFSVLLKGKTESFVVSEFPSVLGRNSEDVDVSIFGYSISRSHCKLVEEDRHVYVQDLNSTMGTMVDGVMLQPDENIFQGLIPAELEELFQLPDRKYSHTEYPCCNTNLPGILIWQNEMLFDCFDNIYNQAVNEGRDIILNGLYWTFPKDHAHLAEILEEISHAISSLGRLLLILNRIHTEEEEYGSNDPQ